MSSRIVVVAFALCVIVAVTLWPLLSMTAAFACCGAAHVVVELRYIALRFRDRLSLRAWWLLGGVLLAIVVVRSAVAVSVLSSSTAAAVELLLATLALAIGVSQARASGARFVGVVIMLGIAAVALTSPLHTLLVLSVLHNLTPIGFVVERALPAHKLRTLLVASAAMCGVPLFVASGAPLAVGAAYVDVVTAWPSSPALYDAYAVWLTPSLFDAPNALALFSAAVSAQLLHYGAVLWWLPREARRSGEGVAASATGVRRIALGVVVIGVVALAIGFAVDFNSARVVYGLFAAVHAWIELPVLFVALSAATATSDPA